MDIALGKDIEYLFIFSLVLILPKVLLRFRLPSGITALLIGIVFSVLSPELESETLFKFLSQIGITSLFLFAGLEVEVDELKRDFPYLKKYLLKFLTALFLITVCFHFWLELSVPNSLIFALGIFTPSAGFILTSLHSFNTSLDQDHWIKSKAISKEVLSITLLFIALQGSDVKALLISLVFFTALYLVLPWMFKMFFKFISPYAPNSEIAFLVVLSLTAGIISKEIGAYYLVGAFVVGLIGSRFKAEIFKDGEVALFRSLSNFFTVFLPFYFFSAGLKLSVDGFTLKALGVALIMVVIFVPLRMALVVTSVKYFLKNTLIKGYKISLSLIPTLIFGLVIAGVLLQRGEVDKTLVYALIIYTLITSLLPTIFFPFINEDDEKKLETI